MKAIWLAWLLGIALWIVGDFLRMPNEPFLALVLLTSSLWRREWVCLVFVVFAGWWSEAVILAPLGSVMVPLLIVFVMLRWVIHHFALNSFTEMIPWLSLAAWVGNMGQALLYCHKIVCLDRSVWTSLAIGPTMWTMLCCLLLRPVFNKLTSSELVPLDRRWGIG